MEGYFGTTSTISRPSLEEFEQYGPDRLPASTFNRQYSEALNRAADSIVEKSANQHEAMLDVRILQAQNPNNLRAYRALLTQSNDF